MKAEHHLLLAIDESEPSLRAVEYVASVVRASPQFRIRLLHVLPHIPSGLLEHGGRDTAEEEDAVHRELDQETRRWRRRCETAAAALIEDARGVLQRAGVAPDRIAVEFAAPLPEESIGYHVLHAATERACDTVVVGRAPRSWLRRAFHASPSAALFRRKARGLAVWIVT